MKTLKGFKAFDKDFTCRGFKFEVGKEYEVDGKISLCGNGFHFCINAQDCINYYSRPTCFAEVEAIGEWITDGDKTVTKKIRIVREIPIQELQLIANTGKENSGYSNSGNYNSGYRNSGNYNSGYRNSGDYNSGDCNSGDYNSGNRNSGDCNSGDCNSGDYNSGYRNSGNRNSGNYNSGDYNSGIFNSSEPNTRMFNQETNFKLSSFSHEALSIISNNLYEKFNVWVSSEIMTNDEKEKYPSHTTTGGFLRVATYKEAWSLMWENLTRKQRDTFKTLPNFDVKIFEEITGVKYENQMSKDCK